ncbi:Vacuolar calcium ion transporter [Ceratobasidium theobromae]|uniref:Vacuolar calcium ion transporter n=1 Tax=Ceratobasidium theobromae TaxID=1582974 RepID=A0A5N5QUM9_9AGAM|nr:Vacuolar calcium ion transporter [Ceratobasidium theobromae]
MTAESQPLLANGNGHTRQSSFIQKISQVFAADGEPGWIDSTKFILLSSWFNILLVFIPLAFAADKLGWDAGLRFAFSFIAIIPLAKLLGEATEQLSMRLGQTLGGLLNASFGNAVEIIVGIAALLQGGWEQPVLQALDLYTIGELRIVQTSMLGSVLSNLLLVLGMSFLAGGLCFHEQNFQVTAAQTGASLMTLACITLVIPAAYHSNQQHPSKPLSIDNAFNALMGTDAPNGNELSRRGLLLISRGTAIILLIVYISYLIFQLKTHNDLFASLGEEEEEEASMSVISAGFWLLAITVVTSFAADILVGSIEQTAEKYHIPKTFIGLILLPLVANAAEHVTSVWMAMKGKLELTIGISVGSSIQIAAFVVPLLVIFSWIIGKELTLYFADFETVSLFVSVILVNLLIMDGKSNYMEGLMLCALYIVIAIAWHSHNMAQFLTRGKKIIAIGRNYLEHIKELGNTVPPEPFFFLKPTTSYLTGRHFEVPQGVLVHHEVELGVVIGKTGRDISEAQADSYVAGYTLSIDMTARNMQEHVKKRGLPWTASKGFDTFTPTRQVIIVVVAAAAGVAISDLISGSACYTADMINRIPRLINHVSSIMTLEEGDLILTGTPHGVGPVHVGDRVTAGLAIPDQPELLASLEVEAIPRNGGYIFRE